MRGPQQNSGSGGVQPRVLNLLAKQQFDLVKNPASGIIFYQNEDGDVLDIQADIIGPVQTAYEGGIFRCKLVIESGFPQSAPKGFFLTKIFHPNVAQNTGEICVNTLKRDWNPAKWTLKHIFEVIRCLLIVPFPESSLNEEAGREFMGDYNSFCEHASVYTQIHAKPNAAQKEIIRKRQQEEAEQQANEERQAQQAQQKPQQLQSNIRPSQPQQALPAGLQQENANQVTPQQPQLPSQNLSNSQQTSQQLHSQQNQSLPDVSLEKQQRFIQSEEESKEKAPIMTAVDTQPVLSQVTNSFERPAGFMGIKLPQHLVIIDHENSASYEKPVHAQNLQAFSKGGQHFSILSSQMTMASQTASGNNRGSFTMNNGQTMLINSQQSNNIGLNDQNGQLMLVRRPSVLYKKKTETAKQRQERYIRRV